MLQRWAPFRSVMSHCLLLALVPTQPRPGSDRRGTFNVVVQRPQVDECWIKSKSARAADGIEIRMERQNPLFWRTFSSEIVDRISTCPALG